MKQRDHLMRLLAVPLVSVLIGLMPTTGSHGQEGLSGSEIAQLAGTTTSQRANMICTLAPRARDGLTALETAIALGGLSGVYRLKALTCLAPHIQTNLTGSEAAQIVGAGKSFRADMACRIADHVTPNLPAAEVDLILDELSGVYRLKALKCLEPRLALDLIGGELAQVVGDGLSFRKDMLCAISSHAQGALASDQLALALGGLSGTYRLQAIKCLEPSTASALSGNDLARIVGPGTSFRKHMLCALAGHISSIMPAAELSMALGDLAGVYRLQAIQCLDPNALAVTDRLLTPTDNPLRQDPEPQDLPALDSPIPFARGQIWRGQYQCSSRVADLELVILGADNSRTASQAGSGYQVPAIFNFSYRDNFADGAFYTTGTYNIDDRSVRFIAGNWIERPLGYRTVNMDGRLSDDGRTFSGMISTSNCRAVTAALTSDTWQPPEAPTPGIVGSCGSTLLQRIGILDQIWFMTEFPVPLLNRAVDFGAACSGHDACYSRIGPSKTTCDTEFLMNVQSSCGSTFPGGLWITAKVKCDVAADRYFAAVRDLGCEAFLAARVREGVVHPVCD